MKKNVVIGVLCLVVILLGGYLIYAEFINKKECSATEEKEETKTVEVTADERYKNYLSNMYLQNIDKSYSIFKVVSLPGETEDITHAFYLTQDNSLYVEYEEGSDKGFINTVGEEGMDSTTKVSIPGVSDTEGVMVNIGKVADIFLVEGNGLEALGMLFAITTDGNVYFITSSDDNINDILATDYKPELVSSLKYIVSINDVSSCGESSCWFDTAIVDIDGNISLFSDHDDLMKIFNEKLSN